MAVEWDQPEEDPAALAQKGQPNGIATLDGTGNVPADQLDNAAGGDLSAYATDVELADHAAETTDVHGTGVNVTSDNIDDYAPAPDLSGYALDADLDAEAAARASADTAEATARANAVTAEATTRATADATIAGAAAAAQATANAALPKAGGTMTGDVVLAGDPTANLHPASRQYVLAQIAALINGAPGALDTLKEIADQLASDESAVSALTSTVAGKLAAASNLSDLVNAATARTNLGLGSAATHPAGDFETAGAAAAAQAASQPLDADLTAIAALSTTAFGRGLLALADAAAGRTALAAAPLASPAFTGNPTVPDQAAGDNSGKAANTKYVDTASGLLVPKSLVDAKGDLLVGTANDTVARKAVGADGKTLKADSTQADGLAWADDLGIFSTFSSGDWIHPVGSAAPATGGAGSGQGQIVPIVIGKTVTLDRIGCNVASAATTAGTARLGIYADNGSGKPGALLLDAGTVSTLTTGLKEIVIALTLSPGIYWLVLQDEHSAGSPTYTGVALPIAFIGRTDQAGAGSGWRILNTGPLLATGATATRANFMQAVAPVRVA